MRLRRKGRIWYARVYLNGTRVDRSTHCHDRRAAETVARNLERQAADPGSARAATATLTDAVRLLLETRIEQAEAGRRSPDTVDFYRAKTGQLLRVLGPSFPLASISAATVDSYISRRRQEGTGEGTIHKELVAMRCAIKLAKRAGLWQGDIDAVLPVAFSPAYKPRKRALSPQELSGLLAHLPADRGARVAFIVATSACWRETELARREDVTATVVRIRGTKRETRFRKVPPIAPWQKSLLAYATAHAQGQDGLLFLPWGNVRRDLHAACTKAGIAPCSPNDLRRTYGQWLRAAGVSDQIIATTMGHADTRMLEHVYGRFTDDQLRERFDRELWPTIGPHSADSAAFMAPTALHSSDNPPNSLPRGGIEPPTRGFSVPTPFLPSPRKLARLPKPQPAAGPELAHLPRPRR